MSGRVCTYNEIAAEQMTYAADVLEARGDLEPGSPEAEAFVEGYLKDVTMHEVGHTLGLRHNFRSSRIYTQHQLADPAFTRPNGITGSVMEYAPINLNSAESRASATARRSTTRSARTTTGRSSTPTSRWRRACRPPTSAPRSRRSPAAAPSRCSPTAPTKTTSSASIPRRCSSTSAATSSPSPRSGSRSRRSCSSARRRGRCVADQDYNVLKRSVSYALRDVARAANVLSRQIGGVRTVRDAPGTGRDPLTPVPVAEQREALDVITGSLLAADSFRVSPALQRKLGTDFSERTDAILGGEGSTQTDYSPSEQVLGLQRSLLAVMMSDTVATRLLESSEKAPTGAGRALRMPELYSAADAGGLERARRHGGDIAPLRREVQRDHVNRIAALLIRPGAASRADTRSTLRAQARVLLERIRAREPPRRPERGERGRISPTAPTRSSRRCRPACSAPAPDAAPKKTAARRRPLKGAGGARG